MQRNTIVNSDNSQKDQAKDGETKKHQDFVTIHEGLLKSNEKYNFTKTLLISHNYKQFLKKDSKHAVQFGISVNSYLAEMLPTWQIIGYDYTEVAKSHYANQENISLRFQDLNELSESKKTLAYENSLHEDLKQATNIFAINVLEHLDDDALKLLVIAIMTHSKPDSVIVIQHWYNKESHQGEMKNFRQVKYATKLQQNYIMSFFAARTDFTVFDHRTYDPNESIAEKENLHLECFALKKVKQLPSHLVATPNVVNLYNEFTIDHQEYIASGDNRYLKTNHYFKKYEHTKYLNLTCKRALELGIGVGDFYNTKPYSDWRIVGYDYSDAAIDYLSNKKNITVRKQDLNAINADKSQLLYQNQLKKDLQYKTNIFLIHVLEFLTDDALLLLVKALIDFSQPDSVIFFRNFTYDETSIDENKCGPIRHNEHPQLLNPNYLFSIFSRLGSMEPLYFASEKFKDVDSDKANHTQSLVVRKK